MLACLNAGWLFDEVGEHVSAARGEAAEPFCPLNNDEGRRSR
jgi:hypothetical protein